jgi:hypothetical protein
MNKKNSVIAIPTILLLIIILFIPAIGTEQIHDNIVPGVILVKFETGKLSSVTNNLSLEDILVPEIKSNLRSRGFVKAVRIFENSLPGDTIATSRTGTEVKLIDISHWYLVEISDTVDVLKFKEHLEKVPGILNVCPGISVKPSSTYPDDPRFQSGLQWGLYNYYSPGNDIHAPTAWDMNTGRSDVIVAVVDGGVDYTHSDLDPGNRSRVIQGYDFGNDDNDPMDNLNASYRWAGHGTKVAGVIGAITDNTSMVSGIMWNCKIMPIKIANSGGWGPFGWGAGSAFNWDIADGISYATSHGVDIINMSFGGEGVGWWENLIFGNPIREATWNAYQQGVILLAAMGNDDISTVKYPAGFPWTGAVGATDQNDDRVSNVIWGSNFGAHINISAPGINYYTTYRGNDDGSFGGTSCATPVASGAAGLILSEGLDRGYNLTNNDVLHLLELSAADVNSATYPGWDQYLGYGRINIAQALEYLNDPYNFVHGNATGGSSQLTRNNHKHTFFNNAGLASGWYVARQYKVTKTVNFNPSYPETPFVWIRERTSQGWSGANPNIELPWIQIININTSSVTFETFVYYILSNSLGQPINQWYPTSPSSARFDYTVIGLDHPPLSVTISGPSYLPFKASAPVRRMYQVVTLP